MRWTKLQVTNFLSFKEFTLNLDGRGVVLIEGENLTSNKFKSNGSGKSSLFEPIVYALYDVTSKGMKADDVVNNQVKKNTSVILEGYKGDDLYRIERYRKHSKQKNKVKLFVNDKEITEKSAAATNKVIEQIVGIDYTTFINSIMFSQGNGAGRFAIATDKEKKDILENLVNLQVYADAQEVAKKRVKDKEAEINTNIRDQERSQWELAQVDTLEQQDQANYQTTKQNIQTENQKLKDNVDYLQKYITDNIGKVDEIRARREQLEEQKNNIGSVDLTAITNELNAATQEINSRNNRKQQLTYQKNELVKKYKQLQTNTHCPVCGNELDTPHRDKEMNEIKEGLRPLLIEIQQIDAELPGYTSNYDAILDQYNQQKQDNDNIMTQYRGLVEEIQKCDNYVRTYENNVQNIKNNNAAIKNTLERLMEVPEPKSRDKDRKAIEKKIKDQKKAQLELEREKTKLENVVKIFSNQGVKSHVLDLVTPFLNERGNKYLAMLSGPDMELKFDTQKLKADGTKSDKFDVELLNKVGGETYKSNSEGEKKRADLSISLALQDLVMSRGESACNFVIYDEVFDALDSVGAENVITLLRERSKEVGSIFVITHSEHLKPLFEKVITVTKSKDAVSTLAEGEGTT
jgi:DNA repair exonuclease SbcCD ATPase subunit